jgi:hypothetical protein
MDDVQTPQDERALPAAKMVQTLALLTQMVNQNNISLMREGSWENDEGRELRRAVEPVPRLQPKGRYVLGSSPHRAGSRKVRGLTYRNTGERFHIPQHAGRSRCVRGLRRQVPISASEVVEVVE